jgi:gamma-glutamyl hydrolase
MQNDPRFAGYKSYIMSSNVEFLQSAGARVVPLIRDDPEEVTLDKLSKLDGVLYPGGDGNYTNFGRFVFEKVLEYNDKGVYYPILGICMGYENITVYAATQGIEALEKFEYYHVSMPVEFKKDPRNTLLYGALGD